MTPGYDSLGDGAHGNPQGDPGCPQMSTEFSTATYRAVRRHGGSGMSPGVNSHGLSPDLMRLMSSPTCS